MARRSLQSTRPFFRLAGFAFVAIWCGGRSAAATPEFVEHLPTTQVFGEPAGITMREPDVPREDEAVEVWARIGYSFFYTDVAMYYTTDGSAPSGNRGTPSGTSQVRRSSLSQITFVRNEPSGGGNIDWWRATLPASTRQYQQQVRYVVGAWHSGGGPEVFGNNYNCSDGTCDNPAGTPLAQAFTNKLAWPGRGAGNANPGAGYPPVSFWKEEAVIGNTFCAGQLDQNGSYYDFHFPTPGCVFGVGTKNEGYVDGLDTFPPGLPQAWRGQMHLNQAMVGVRLNGLTHWLSNPNAVSYNNIQQSYLGDTNIVSTSSSLPNAGADIRVEQYDFAPYGVTFPNNTSGAPERHIAIKRIVLTNNSPTTTTVNVYFYMDPALNGGDNYDAMFWDASRGAMTAFDKTTRDVTGTGTGFTDPNEYNPTTFGSYHKNIALYLTAAMKVAQADSGGGGTPAADSWRDTSLDNGQGWIGVKVTLDFGVSKEIDVALLGAYFRPANPLTDPMPVNDGVYDNKIVPMLDWFQNSALGGLMQSTSGAWQDWLYGGTRLLSPETRYNQLMARALLGTAVHFDGVHGGIIAGFHNGAYPFVWPRDAVYAAITLARTGHTTEAAAVYRWMRDTCFRDDEPSWGFNAAAGRTYKGFWKQKYTTDGYVVWGAPQIDETAVYPWGLKYQFDMTADIPFLNSHSVVMREAVRAMTEDSQDSRLYFIDPPGVGPGTQNLMYSNNVWEDSYAPFLYSNASVWRGLEDARYISSALGDFQGALDAFNRRNTIKSGLDGRLAADNENCDISFLGVSYPFNVYAANDSRVAHLADRVNGVVGGAPLVNFVGEHTGTINRYAGDGYWNGGPWFLSTLWYGLYYAQRADFTTGSADIDNHKSRMDLCIDRLGPVGLGAEQIAYGFGPGASLLYPGQQDFKLQAAWPNAWESMSTFADSVMAFFDYRPDAVSNTMEFNPRRPSSWPFMGLTNVTLIHTPTGRTHKVDFEEVSLPTRIEHRWKNRSGFALNARTTIKTDLARCFGGVLKDGVAIAHVRDPATGRVTVNVGALNTGAFAITTVAAFYRTADVDDGNGTGTPDGGVTIDDLLYYLFIFDLGLPAADVDDGTGTGVPDGGVTIDDLLYYLAVFDLGCA